MLVRVVCALCLVSVSSAVAAQDPSDTASQAMTLGRAAVNLSLAGAERDVALAGLERADLDAAIELSKSLVGDGDLTIRARAAWILASTDHDAGGQVLRKMAESAVPESVMAIECLGRLRDAEGHALLQRLLRKELSTDSPSPSRISAFVQSLGDYGDPRDGVVVGSAIQGRYQPTDWVDVEAAGRTGGIPISVGEDLFRKARGWTKISAGLALARVGNSLGVDYVERLLKSAFGSGDSAASRIESAERDDANGPRARDFVLERLGAAADEVFLPDILRIIDRNAAGSRLSLQAWRALLRIDPARLRDQIVDLAWKQDRNEFAAKLIAIHDADTASAILSSTQSEDYRLMSIRRALMASERERRRWRELHGYTF